MSNKMITRGGGTPHSILPKGGRVGVSLCLPTLCKGGQRRCDESHRLIDSEGVTL